MRLRRELCGPIIPIARARNNHNQSSWKTGWRPFSQYYPWNQNTPDNFLDEFDYLLFSAGADSPHSYEETYLRNSQKIAHAAMQSTQLKQIVYTSSCAVYGDHGGAFVNEESELKQPKQTITF